MKRSIHALGLSVGLAGSMAIAGCHWHGLTPFDNNNDVVEPLPPDGFPPDRPPGVQPVFGETVVAQTAPPPITGGTLLALNDGVTMVAADPDRDVVFVVDVKARQKITGIALGDGAQPGRSVEDAAHRVHVVLRGTGEVLDLDSSNWSVLSRRAVCATPRGIAYDADNDQIHVACAGGELVSLPAAGGDAVRTLRLDRDLRDVIVRKGQLLVTRFHSAQLIALDSDGKPLQRFAPATGGDDFSGVTFTPGAAWRTVLDPTTGGVIMAHQRATNGTVPTSQPGGYGDVGSGCGTGSIVEGTVSAMTPDQVPVATPSLPSLVLPVDLAVSAKTGQIAVVSAANAHTPGANRIVFTNTSNLNFNGGCGFADSGDSTDMGEPTAVAFTSDDKLVVQSREPARLYFSGAGDVIELSDESRADTGHAIFHSNSGAGLACASCHLEGGEDGRVWSFENSGPRRTQSIRGGILGTEPFHWDGDQHDFSALMTEVFGHRMAGPTLQNDQQLAMQTWVNRIPSMPAMKGDPAAIARGEALFNDQENVGCVTCHAGPHKTDNSTVDVGTGGMFQVPSLRGIAWRAPYMHDGRAETLFERFTPIGGGDQHGVTSQLNAQQIADLIAYLETL